MIKTHILQIMAVFVILKLMPCGISRADEPRLDLLKHVGIDQHLDAQISPDLIFHDEAGHDVRLGNFFGKRPIILSLVYYGCPQLCTTVLNELSVTLNVLPTNVGEPVRYSHSQFLTRLKLPCLR